MDGTWGMHKGESCHARLQVSGLSTWVDGGAFFQIRGMTGGGAEIEGKYQDFAPETRSLPRRESSVEGGGRVAYILDTIPSKNCHLRFSLWTTHLAELWPHFSEVTNGDLGGHLCPESTLSQCSARW